MDAAKGVLKSQEVDVALPLQHYSLHCLMMLQSVNIKPMLPSIFQIHPHSLLACSSAPGMTMFVKICVEFGKGVFARQ